MTEYRNRTTGEVKTQGELRRDNPNISFPKVWNSNVYDSLNVDPVMIAAAPTEGIGAYQHAVRNGVEQNSNGDWVHAWQIVDMFADIEGGQTKAEQETEYQTRLDNDAAKNNRSTRNSLIAETDWWASSDLTMSSDQTAYRQALRDISAHSNWPHLQDSDWPTKP
tara:strand:- start:4805 stop:5299 length:495 start_codon:yes stop_codon:yes gene_type:complete